MGSADPTSVRLVSDLHLFAQRSRGDEQLPAIHRAASAADLFVLAGDTFDFKWAHQPCAESFAEDARNWLHDLVAAHPTCRFQFLLGNHDHHPALIERLDHLGAELANFTWDPWYLREGGAIFLHGDVANGYSTSTQLERYRQRCKKHKRRPGAVRNRFYDALISTKVDRGFARAMFPTKRVAERITRYLEHIGHCAQSGTRDVFFGHTHRPLSGYEHKGLRFHNAGAPIKGSPFQILEATI